MALNLTEKTNSSGLQFLLMQPYVNTTMKFSILSKRLGDKIRYAGGSAYFLHSGC